MRSSQMYSSQLKQSQLAPSEEVKSQHQGLTDYEGAKSVAKRLFETYDRDKDGVIDSVEVVPMIVDSYKAFNRSFTPSRVDIESYTKVLDRDRDGRITQKDIEELAIRYLCPQQPIPIGSQIGNNSLKNSMRQSQQFQFETFKKKKFNPEIQSHLNVAKINFEKIDREKTGFIEEYQVPELLKLTYQQMGVENYKSSIEDVKSWIKMTDVDEDGKIGLDEYEFLVIRSLQQAGIKFDYM